MTISFYPLQFVPIFKDRIWGGTKLNTVLNKAIPSDYTGESWELSSVKGDVSIAINGIFKGKLLTELIADFPNEILGTKVFQRFGLQFPLLFKYLDAKEDLSIQVHPNDALAKKRHQSFGKTEMWYVVDADATSRIIVGFNSKSNPEEYLENLEKKTIISLLETIPVHKGDAFFLETGTIHAIGAGLVIAEIQQTSDITYRLYDFDREDVAGNKRELHIDLALDAINYEKVNTKKTYLEVPNNANQIVDCTYFTTNFIPLNSFMKVEKNGDSFTVYMCVSGAFEIEIDTNKFQYSKGDTVLIPAGILNFNLIGIASLLEIYIK